VNYLDTSALIKRFVAEEITFAAADEGLPRAAEAEGSRPLNWSRRRPPSPRGSSATTSIGWSPSRCESLPLAGGPLPLRKRWLRWRQIRRFAPNAWPCRKASRILTTEARRQPGLCG